MTINETVTRIAITETSVAASHMAKAHIAAEIARRMIRNTRPDREADESEDRGHTKNDQDNEYERAHRVATVFTPLVHNHPFSHSSNTSTPVKPAFARRSRCSATVRWAYCMMPRSFSRLLKNS